MSFRTDVFVVGGGPAGLAAAIAARRRGLQVALADAGSPPQDKACGEGLMPDGVAAARALDIDLSAVRSYPFRGIRFCGRTVRVAADFPNGPGFGIRRTVLHGALVEHAERAGVRMMWGQRVEGIGEGEVRLSGETVRARFIVGADGGRSRVRAWSNLEAGAAGRRYGFRRHFAVAPWTPYMELHWSKRAQLYMTPVAHDEVCVALISRDPRLRLREAMKLFPQMEDRLRGAAGSDSEQGAVTASRRLHRVTRGNVALVGDASGSVDAITGQGLSLSFQQGAVLADAMAAGDLSRYERAHPRLMRRPRLMAGLMLTLDGRGWLQNLALRGMDLWPRSFAALLEFHVGA